MILASGRFESFSKHTIKGGFSVNLGDDGIVLKTDEDFFFSGSRAPGWAFFKGTLNANDPLIETAALAYRIRPITTPSGEPFIKVVKQHIYQVPDYLQVSKFDGIMAWCYGTPALIGAGYFYNSPNNEQSYT